MNNSYCVCCRVGALVWGTVRRVQDFGAFVGFDDTRASGLIHISNISRQHVGYTDVRRDSFLLTCFVDDWTRQRVGVGFEDARTMYLHVK